MAGPGDYYVGNDFIQIAIDGTPFDATSQHPIAGAAGGGSIVDAGFLTLDTSYQRVTMPSDALERLTVVVNQEPTVEFVADSFVPNTNVLPAVLTITGHLVDPNHRLPNANLDNDGRVLGVTVTQTITLGTLDRYFTLSTTVVNGSGAAVGIRSIGDYLHQTSGGYKFVVPAGLDIAGNPLPQNWGVQIPGSDFGNPIATSVQSNFVGLLALEPGSTSVDCHASLGLMCTDTPTCMVTSDPQDALGNDRPIFPSRIIVGSLPLAPDGLAPGATLAYNRRLYINGGTSASGTLPTTPSVLFNTMELDRFNLVDGLWMQDYGWLSYGLSGSAIKMGPLPTEVRLERAVRMTGTDPTAWTWVPERVDWMESGENITSRASLPSSSVLDVLPTGTYRLVVTNQLGTQVKYSAVNLLSPLNSLSPGPIIINPRSVTGIGGTDYLCPEASQIVDASGTAVTSLYAPHFFTTRPGSLPSGAFMPDRIVIKGTNGTPDPWVRRARTLGSFFDPITKVVQDAPGGAPGLEQYRAANEMFGTGFYGGIQNTYFWVRNGRITGQVAETGVPVVSGGSYRAYATRGPLSDLNYLDFLAYNGQSAVSHNFIVWPRPLPSGWVTFDLPGPSQATGGGYLPGEKLASGLAEGVDVIGHTEKDLGTDGDGLYNDFTWAFNASNFLTEYLQALGSDPFVVGARTSDLTTGFGTATSLFTPVATRYRFGGAIQPDNWELSDFITQAQGQYTIIHEPRGPQGLFTAQNFDSTTLASQGFPSWWSHSGIYANGVTNGGFDALELLRGEGFDRTNPDPWFQEFKTVRADWFNLLNVQTPAQFTKALGLSSAVFSLDTPVGLARTYLKAAPQVTVLPVQGLSPPVPLVQDLTTVLQALKNGNAVVSTGPFLDVSVSGTGPGGLVKGPMATATVTVNLYRSDWMPVDEVRIILNGQEVLKVDAGTLQAPPGATDPRLVTGQFQVTMPTTGTGAWIVVEAGVPLTQTGAYQAGSTWDIMMRGIYPIAVTNPIFIDVTGNGYTHP